MKTHKKLRYERLIFVIVSILLLGFGISKIIAKPDPYKELKASLVRLPEKSRDRTLCP